MSDTGTGQSVHDDDAVEALLKHAAPRPAPPAHEVSAVRDAVRAEWRRTTGRRRRVRQVTRFAVAASVIVAAFLALNTLRTGGVAPETVATIDRQFGLVRVLGENARLSDGASLTDIVSGLVLDTGDDAGVALSWSTGGSLRIDAGTRLEFVSGSAVRLHWGRIYFDSAPALAGRHAGPEARLVIDTEFGRVSHVGTRYMTAADGDGITVSVRDGMVRATTPSGREWRVGGREQLQVSRDGAFTTTNIRPFGPAWAWTERMSPGISLDGRSVLEFLEWVSHETGLSLRFGSPAAEAYARQESLNGQLTAGPRQALEVWMLATDLRWHIDNETGALHVDTR